MKRIIFLFIIIFSITGCKTIQINTSYGYKVTTKKENEVYNKIDIGTTIMDTSKKEKSPLTRVSISSKDEENNIKETPKTIKIISNKKEYIINIDSKYNTIYPVYDNGIIIDSDNFILEIGNIKFKNGTILNIPPLLIKRYVYVYKINNFLDALNQNTREDLFEGTIEEYREWKKKNINK
ncbi:hypothetical protein [Fusobacterium russii]|uniref:hypothetical protein n=1 Tax=Fusobacterium russii TaxID=854 RepID=UPI0003A2C099|nr:hypothetical protein [Fusobacterium russii]